MKYSKKQLNAISRSYSKRKAERQEKYIIEHAGGLDEFKKSGYKTMTGYIKHKFGVVAL